MPHVAFLPFSGVRVREEEVLSLGMTLPGLRERGAAVSQLPALGLLTLAGMLPQDWTCSYRPVSEANEALLEEVVAERPTLAALSALTASVDEAYHFSEQLRQRGIRTVMGGLHVTSCAAEARQFCDAVVIGDGESVWTEVLRDAESGRLQPEYRATTQFDLARSPVPRFDLLGPSGPPRYTVQTQRGCPLKCDFCGASRLLGAFREKPASNLARELEIIVQRSQSPLVELADDNTFAGSRDAGELLDVLRASGVRYFTEADWRIGTRPDILRGLAKSGCVQVLVGIESISFRYPGMGPKNVELSRIIDAIAAIQEAGVAVNGCFIVGAEGETRESMDRLAEFILASPLADVQVTIQTPFPGTGLYQRLADQERLLPERGWSYYTLFDVTYQPDKLSVAELEQGFRDLLRVVYSEEAAARRRKIRRRIWHNNPRLLP